MICEAISIQWCCALSIYLSSKPIVSEGSEDDCNSICFPFFLSGFAGDGVKVPRRKCSWNLKPRIRKDQTRYSEKFSAEVFWESKSLEGNVTQFSKLILRVFWALRLSREIVVEEFKWERTILGKSRENLARRARFSYFPTELEYFLSRHEFFLLALARIFVEIETFLTKRIKQFSFEFPVAWKIHLYNKEQWTEQ